MTNAEKFLRDGVDIKEFAYMIQKEFDEDEPIAETIIDILYTEAKPTLTIEERVILENIKNGFSIERDIDGDLLVKIAGGEVFCISMYNHLFQFIKERRRIRNKGVTR